MIKVKVTGDYACIYCPACDDWHCLSIGKDGWQFNGDIENPTFSPSLLVKSGHYIDGGNKETCEFCTGKSEYADCYKCNICHSFIKDGKIQYLSDCTHDLAGKTIELGECK